MEREEISAAQRGARSIPCHDGRDKQFKSEGKLILYSPRDGPDPPNPPRPLSAVSLSAGGETYDRGCGCCHIAPHPVYANATRGPLRLLPKGWAESVGRSDEPRSLPHLLSAVSLSIGLSGAVPSPCFCRARGPRGMGSHWGPTGVPLGSSTSPPSAPFIVRGAALRRSGAGVGNTGDNATGCGAERRTGSVGLEP